MAGITSRFTSLFAPLAMACAVIAAWSQVKPETAVSQAYADPAVCAQCHTKIAASYAKTGMGRSFHRAHPETVEKEFMPATGVYRHEASSSYFAMVLRDGKYIQRRWEIGADGKETNVDEKQVDFIMGSGNHARTFLHLTQRNTLEELPLAWYADKGGYFAMNPGYDRPDYPGSARPIYYECMFCHNGYPKIPEGSRKDHYESVYAQPLPEGIDCQRCHGPGQRHVDRAKAGAPVAEVRAAIVNPARLSTDRQMEVCMQCHLETSVDKLPHAIRRFERGPFSYRPGQPLGDFSIAFDRAPGTNNGFEVVGGAYRLRESQCFLKSQGKLTCTTCHNPHDIPRGETAAASYNAICRNCHTAELARLAATGTHGVNADCVSCHMPKRRTDDAVHMVMTDHLIQRIKPAGDLLAEKPGDTESPASSYRGEVFLYYPPKLAPENTLYMAVAQVRDGSNLQNGLPRLKQAIEQLHPANPSYYAELAEGYLAAGDTAAATRYFEEAARRDPTPGFRLAAIGDVLMQTGQWPKAEIDLRQAVKLSPDDTRAWGHLGWTLWQENKAAEARADLEKAIALDPDIPDIHNNLGLLLWGTGDRKGAENEFRAALRIEPGVAEWRLNLGRALAAGGQSAEAVYQVEQSLKFKPDYVDARLVYAQLLMDLNRPGDAEIQARTILKAEPRNPAGHELLGSLLADRNADAAIAELQTAVGIEPDFWRAQFELGVLLARKGDLAGAVQHLTVAAQGKDPQASAAARQVLQQVGAPR